MSIGFLVDPEQPMVWRGPMVTQALTQLLGDTDWGDLDYLVVDMPPGTGDIQLTLAQRVPVAGAVIVTTPQDIALADARKGLKMFEKVAVPVLGIVENMSVHVCTNCGHVEHMFGAGGGARMAAQYGVALLGELPLDARMREEADGGAPTVVAAPDSPRAAAVLRNGAPHRGGAGAPRAGTAAACFRRSSSKKARELDEHQVRQLDPPHGARTAHDRAVRAGAGARTRTAQDRFVRHLELRLRRALRARIQDLHEHQFHDRGSRRHSTRRASSISRPTSASFRRIPSRWRARSNTSGSRARTLVVCLGKSTYARCGIIVNVTPLEPEWEGHVTLEFSNTTPLPAKIYANEGVAQMLFFESDEVCATSYKDRGGKYRARRA